MTQGSHTWQEIISQPETWRATLEDFAATQAALDHFLAQADFDHILVTGCGSTHYLAQTTAVTLAHHTGIPVHAFPSSELWLFPGMIPRAKALLLLISRSGMTTETLWALERFRKVNGGPTLTVTCYPDSPLARRADWALTAPAAQEQSVAQTRSFTSMFLLTLALTAVLTHDEDMPKRLHRLPDALDDLVTRSGDLPQRLGADLSIQKIFFLGGGPLYGLANEAMLKTKEMSLSQAEAYHPLEFRHGPMSVVDEQTLIVGFISDSGLAEELQVLKEMQKLGAHTLALVEGSSVFSNSWQPHHIVELRSGLNEWERGPLYLPLIQRMAYHRALAKGLDPDRPNNLTAVVEL
ncbi:MAG: SIS domain-containing protein [Anaerolineae bacterium]|nr:SIS domain-containing protein [Anaerolineae bacterium]